MCARKLAGEGGACQECRARHSVVHILTQSLAHARPVCAFDRSRNRKGAVDHLRNIWSPYCFAQPAVTAIATLRIVIHLGPQKTAPAIIHRNQSGHRSDSVPGVSPRISRKSTLLKEAHLPAPPASQRLLRDVVVSLAYNRADCGGAKIVSSQSPFVN